MDCSTPGLPVYHQLPEFTQTHVTESVMPSSHLILCHSFLLLPSIFPNVRAFSNESALCIRWPSTGVSASASVLPVNIQDWFPLGWTGCISLKSKGHLRFFSNTNVQKSSSNYYFLTWIQVSQEAIQVVLYSHLFQNFPHFIVIHTVKGFGIVSRAEVGVFLEFLAFLIIHQMLAIQSLVPLPFLQPAWSSGSSWFMYCWSLAWRIFSITLLVCEMCAIVW